jgi:hypothetical protein
MEVAGYCLWTKSEQETSHNNPHHQPPTLRNRLSLYQPITATTAGHARDKAFGTLGQAICIASSIDFVTSHEAKRTATHFGYPDVGILRYLQDQSYTVQQSPAALHVCTVCTMSEYDVPFAYLFSFPPSLPFPFASARRAVTLVFMSSYTLCSSKTASRSRLTVSKTLALTIS